MSYFQNHQQQSHFPDFHHVSAPSHLLSFKAPRPVDVVSDSPPVTPTRHASTIEQQTVNVDSGDEIVRTDKRILWTPDEDERLMRAWVNNLMDPINGNDKRNEQYWADVVETYNLTTPKHRKRSMKQAKDRWHKINKWTDLFHSAWLKSQLIYSSGHSEQDWIDKAHKFYLSDNKDLRLGQFMLMDVWYKVRNEPKWVTYNKGLKNARKRKESDKEETNESIDEDKDDADRPLPQPIGQKKARKMMYEGKSTKSATEVIELDKFEKIQSDAHENRLKVLEMQQKLSAEKVESSKINQLAAKEQKEARKLELEARMMETFTLLSKQDKGKMSDEEKAEHVLTLKCLRKRLFPEIVD
ncbi:hypothetical protein EJB05_53559 [Eragrostis curvula]|uniref:Myb-like domain-containing protein n=1 Tax=Eragrostis curvula TaxID=38414 RepID=A0A5J9SPU4_9POAL|nr:hypothetical protein EJB05_53559 [Eragrostis curvula]